MPTIELTDKELNFLKELAHELKTQDNRAAGTPYYYTVRQPKRIVGLDAAYAGGETVWVDMGSGNFEEYGSRSEAIGSIKKSYMCPDEEAEIKLDEDFVEFGYIDTHTDTNVFFTEKGYLKHMELNGHNYHSEPYSYVQKAFRNPEIRDLLDIVRKIGENGESP